MCFSEQIDDYIRLRSSILKQFKDDEGGDELVKYIEAMDSFMDGNAVGMLNNRRWRLALDPSDQATNGATFETKQSQMCEIDQIA